MDDTELLREDLDLISCFKPLKTTVHFGLHLVFTLSLEITAIVLAILRPDDKYKCQSYFILLYLHVALWFITWVSIHVPF